MTRKENYLTLKELEGRLLASDDMLPLAAEWGNI